MKVDRYKMIYITKTNKELEDKIKIDNVYIFKENIINENNGYNLRILGKDFVKNNKNKGKLIINNKKYKLKEFIGGERKSYQIKINIILIRELSHLNHMFENCLKLKEICFNNNILIINQDNEDFQEIEESNKYNTDYFKGYINIYTDENLKNDNTRPKSSRIEGNENGEYHDNSIEIYFKDNLINNNYFYYDISRIFYNCVLLKSIPNISKMNYIKIISMNESFYNCSSLILLPDISEWNVDNVYDMNGLFYNCSSLSSMSDISKLNMNNVRNLSNMFTNCSSLISLPDISRWNISNCCDMSWIFSDCSYLFHFMIYLNGILKML